MGNRLNRRKTKWKKGEFDQLGAQGRKGEEGPKFYLKTSGGLPTHFAKAGENTKKKKKEQAEITEQKAKKGMQPHKTGKKNWKLKTAHHSAISKRTRQGVVAKWAENKKYHLALGVSRRFPSGCSRQKKRGGWGYVEGGCIRRFTTQYTGDEMSRDWG